MVESVDRIGWIWFGGFEVNCGDSNLMPVSGGHSRIRGVTPHGSEDVSLHDSVPAAVQAPILRARSVVDSIVERIPFDAENLTDGWRAEDSRFSKPSSPLGTFLFWTFNPEGRVRIPSSAFTHPLFG